MSDLRGISEKCADVLKMYEPLVVLDDVVVTVDKEKERLYIVSKEDGACKEFKLGDGGIEEKTDEEQLYVDSSNSIHRLFRTMSMFSYKNNMCGYGDKLYIFSYKSFSNQVAQMFDIKTFEKRYDGFWLEVLTQMLIRSVMDSILFIVKEMGNYCARS